jgi:hypothetical protein
MTASNESSAYGSLVIEPTVKSMRTPSAGCSACRFDQIRGDIDPFDLIASVTEGKRHAPIPTADVENAGDRRKHADYCSDNLVVPLRPRAVGKPIGS